MKGIDMIFCASQASTSICPSHHHLTTMDVDHPLQSQHHPSSSSSSSAADGPQLGGRAIDRHNPIIRDSQRRLSFRATITPTLSAPCSSSQPPPINPAPYHQLHIKPKPAVAKDAAASVNNQASKSSKKSNKNKNKKAVIGGSSGDYAVRKQSSLGDFITPPGSSRYLLGGDPGPFDDYNDTVLGLVPVPVPQLELAVHHHRHPEEKENKSSSASAPKLSSSSRFSKPPPSDQVVVLRVSLHCRGCEGKLRKHLSKMEGVTSFEIDFAAKKVKVVGDVTPLSVLASVSKVKNAQFWTAPSVVAGAAALRSSDNKKH